MRHEIRTIYIAEDGKEFSDPVACKKYEDDGCVSLSKIPKYCDHFLLNPENLNFVLNGDGSGYYATETKMSRICPSTLGHPKWATHLVYFGK